jgi:predicted naringenin-chalcone synthase
VSFHIAGIGTSVPKYRIDQERAAHLALSLLHDGHDRGRLLSALYRRAAVRFRHSVLLESSEPDAAVWQTFYPPARHETDRGPTTAERMQRYDEKAGPLAVDAARRAFADARVDAGEVTHLITVSCTGFAAPGVDMMLITALGLPRSVSRTHIGFMGCHGALNGMKTAAAFTAADPDACVLLCAVELCTLHQQYGWNADRIVANSLFSDGAAAILGCGDSRWADRRSGHEGCADLKLLAGGSTRLDESSDFMTWRIGDHGFEMSLAPQVPDMLREHLPGWLVDWLAQHDMALDDIGSWAIHPGGPRILSACAEVLDLTREDLRVSNSILQNFGNISSPTLIFILERLRREESRRPWLMLGFGPGLAIEAVLVD